jgi:hypothetical protein
MEMDKIARVGTGKRGDVKGSALANRGELFATRHMPESLEAEAAVLGSMIIDPECIGEVVETLSAEAFYRIEHQLIFDRASAYLRCSGRALRKK